MKDSLPLLLLLATIMTQAQSRRAILTLEPQSDQARWESPVYQVPLADPEPFLAYFLKWEGTLNELSVRFSPDGEHWSAWQPMPRDEHNPDLPVSVLGITAADRFMMGDGIVA